MIRWLLFFLVLTGKAVCGQAIFVATHQELEKYQNDKNTILINSPGRSGSSMLTQTIVNATDQKKILKTHLLTPKKSWKGKILYIFSNPDRIAESSFHQIYHNALWGSEHFHHMETSDKSWLQMIGNTTKQTLNHNLLEYDALRIANHLSDWLIDSVIECDFNEANILAIKYEHLWDSDVIEVIKEFCELDVLPLPEKQIRGHPLNTLSKLEYEIRIRYNMGSEEDPKYSAYDEARETWEKASKYKLLKLHKN